jgi:zeaxanthin glucosyltransferase
MTQQKKTILVVLYPEWGSLMPIMTLAKALSHRESDVLFVLPRDDSEITSFNNQQLLDYKKYIEKHGFRCQLLRPFPPRSGGLLAEAHRRTEIFANALEDIAQIIKEYNVDLVLIESLVSFVAISAVECGVPYIGLSIEFSGPMNSKIPPSNSSLIPNDNFLSSLMTTLEWTKNYLLVKLLETFHPTIHEPQAFLNRCIRRAGLAKTFSDYGFMVKFPCVYYLLPEALDF